MLHKRSIFAFIIFASLLLSGCGMDGTTSENSIDHANHSNDHENNEEMENFQSNAEDNANDTKNSNNDLVENNNNDNGERTVQTETSTEEKQKESKNNDETELKELSVHFIDVGQADATLFQYSSNDDNYHILFDAGNWNQNDVVDYLHSLHISSLDVMIGSHPHADHIGQMDVILEQFEVDEVWMSGDTTTSQTFERVLNMIEVTQVDYNEPRAGDIYDIGPLTIEIFNPESLTGDVHEGSITAKFSYDEVSFLLTGDAESHTEQSMITREDDLSADILQLGHHGSNTSTSTSFLSAVSPSIAVISAGKDNQYGHPHTSVVERVQDEEIDMYSTAVNGTIIVETDGENIEILLSSEGENGNQSSDSNPPSRESDETGNDSSSTEGTVATGHVLILIVLL